MLNVIFCYFFSLKGNGEGLIGYWRLNEGQGNVANDFSNNQIIGTITNGSWFFLSKILDFSIPTEIQMIINPNQNPSFISQVINISNHAPDNSIDISIIDFIQKSGPNFIHVYPEEKDWIYLTKDESKTYLALGIKPIPSSKWAKLIQEEPLYIKDFQVKQKKFPIGKVKENSTVSFELVANHGYSFEEKESLEFDIIFLIEITYN